MHITNIFVGSHHVRFPGTSKMEQWTIPSKDAPERVTTRGKTRVAGTTKIEFLYELFEFKQDSRAYLLCAERKCTTVFGQLEMITYSFFFIEGDVGKLVYNTSTVTV